MVTIPPDDAGVEQIMPCSCSSWPGDNLWSWYQAGLSCTTRHQSTVLQLASCRATTVSLHCTSRSLSISSYILRDNMDVPKRRLQGLSKSQLRHAPTFFRGLDFIASQAWKTSSDSFAYLVGQPACIEGHLSAFRFSSNKEYLYPPISIFSSPFPTLIIPLSSFLFPKIPLRFFFL
jgi:hypothetical protein